MKNKITFIILLLLLSLSTSKVFAIEDVSTNNAPSEAAKQKELLDSFGNLNPYAKNFFTPHVNKTIVKDDNSILDTGSSGEQNHHGSIPPVKKFRLMIQNRNKPKVVATEAPVSKNQAILDCDFMEYFAPETELHADGHVVMTFPKNNSTVKADKMIYNQSSNLIKAFGHVVLISEGKVLNGDYMQIDMNEENGFMDNPTTQLFQLKAQAKKGYMYGDKIIQEQGSMYITKKTMLDLKAEMFGPDLSTMFIPEQDKSYYMKEGHGQKLKIKTNELLINSKKEHDTLTLKHAEVYFNGKKVGTIPSITMHTNKNQDYVEANFPEIGTVTNLGLYAGPGFVFDTPHGSTLKVVPLLNYQSNADNPDNNKLGFGAIAKFKSATNKTDFAYGTSNKMFIMRGIQRLDDDLYMQYGSNAYLDDWFMGFRMPRLMGELVYQKDHLYKDFLGKNFDMTYTHRIAGAYVQDGNTTYGDQVPLGEDGIGTLRLKYMAEVAQTIYKFNDQYTSPINARLELVGQGSAAVYGTGATQTVARFGPRIHSQYKWWMQDVGYFLSGYSDKTPLVQFDQYMYGRSNVYMTENARICKYLTVSWLGSLNLSQDSWDGNLMQENAFFFAIGPDDIKLNIGYDTVRQQSFVTMAMHLDAKGSTIDYKKMIIKNPDTLGKSKDAKESQSFSPNGANSDDAEQGIERAEIIDIPTEAL